MSTNNDIRLLQRCEGRYCAARETCHRYRAAGHPAQPWPADYSQAPSFKPGNAAESCDMYIEHKEQQP